MQDMVRLTRSSFRKADTSPVLPPLSALFLVCLGLCYVRCTCAGAHVVRLRSSCGELAMVTLGDPVASRPGFCPLVLLSSRNISQQHPPSPVDASPQTQPEPQHQLAEPDRSSRPNGQRDCDRRSHQAIRDNDQGSSRAIYQRLHGSHLRHLLFVLRSVSLGLRPAVWLQHWRDGRRFHMYCRGVHPRNEHLFLLPPIHAYTRHSQKWSPRAGVSTATSLDLRLGPIDRATHLR